MTSTPNVPDGETNQTARESWNSALRRVGWWDSAYQYAQFDLVQHNGALWVAPASSIAVEPGTNPTFWLDRGHSDQIATDPYGDLVGANLTTQLKELEDLKAAGSDEIVTASGSGLEGGGSLATSPLNLRVKPNDAVPLGATASRDDIILIWHVALAQLRSIKISELPTTSTTVWQYSNNLSMVDPGAGRIRFNAASFAAVTAVAISTENSDGVDVGIILDQVQSADSMHAQRDSDNAQAALYSIGTPVDNGTWHEFPLTYASDGGGSFWGNNNQLVVTFG